MGLWGSYSSSLCSKVLICKTGTINLTCLTKSPWGLTEWMMWSLEQCLAGRVPLRTVHYHQQAPNDAMCKLTPGNDSLRTDTVGQFLTQFLDIVITASFTAHGYTTSNFIWWDDWCSPSSKHRVLVAQSCLTFTIPWIVAHQAPLTMEFSRQEYWSGLPFPPPGDLPNPGIKPRSPALQADSLPSEPPWKPKAEKPAAN